MRVGRAVGSLKAAKAMLFSQIEESRSKVIDRGKILSVQDPRKVDSITKGDAGGIESLCGANLRAGGSAAAQPRPACVVHLFGPFGEEGSPGEGEGSVTALQR